MKAGDRASDALEGRSGVLAAFPENLNLSLLSPTRIGRRRSERRCFTALSMAQSSRRGAADFSRDGDQPYFGASKKIPSAYVNLVRRRCTVQTADYARRCPFSLAACAA